MKDVNNLVVALLRELDAQQRNEIGQGTVKFLLGQTADSREWPTDEQLFAQLPSIKAYGNIKQSRLRAFFAIIEEHLRVDAHFGDVTLPTGLEIEHIMPKGWRAYWGEGVADDPRRASQRDLDIHTLGNLTLVTGRLNKDLSNRPWTDNEAHAVESGSEDSGVGKRSLLNRYNLLVLNKQIIDGHVDAWTDADIRARSLAIAEEVTKIWTRPDVGVEP